MKIIMREKRPKIYRPLNSSSQYLGKTCVKLSQVMKIAPPPRKIPNPDGKNAKGSEYERGE
jgi:hypothetical protein